MDVYKIIFNIIENPEAIKFYRELKKYYDENLMLQESSAIAYLLEQKFEKK